VSSKSETDDLTQALLLRFSRLHGPCHGGRFSRLEFPGLGTNPFLVLSRKADLTTGTVKWINDRKGFGLITPDSGGKDLVARIWAPSARATSKSLTQKQKVSFDITADLGGEQAVNIKPIA
jgi:CspA family cold shock protein